MIAIGCILIGKEILAVRATNKFLCLEIGRGVAALLVLFYHIDKYYYNNPKYYPNTLLHGVFKFGHSGVEFFFVLSGFIMIWCHWKDFGQPGKIAEFVKKRVIRIYPLVWFSTLVMVGLYLAMPGAGKSIYREPAVIIQSLALVGVNPFNAIDFPSWTLWHENVFYVFCALIIWRPRVGGAMFAIWTALCLAVAFTSFDAETRFYALAPINVLFFFGAGLAVFLMRHRMPAPALSLYGGLIAFFVFGAACDLVLIDEGIQHAIFGLSATLIVAGAVELERSGRLVLPNWASTVGALSFPLYLTHMFVLPITAKALAATKLIPKAPPLLGLAVFILAAIGAAMIVRAYVDRPATRLLRARLLGGAKS
jgi:peptidoglycan/LPS O-acetylase OafA/YrhL